MIYELHHLIQFTLANYFIHLCRHNSVVAMSLEFRLYSFQNFELDIML